MGKRGPLPGQGDPQSALAVLALPATPPTDVPDAPDGLLPAAAEAWRSFWTSRAATWVDRGSAMVRLYRWIRDVDMYLRILDDLTPGAGKAESRDDDDVLHGVPGVVDSQRPWLGRGSTFQITQHPNAALLQDLDQRIHRAEVEFGMTPLAAVRLAGAGVQGALTAEQLRSLLAKRQADTPADDVDASWAAGLAPAPS